MAREELGRSRRFRSLAGIFACAPRGEIESEWTVPPQDDGALDRVLKLSDVAGPVVGHELAQRRLAELRLGTIHPPRAFVRSAPQI